MKDSRHDRVLRSYNLNLLNILDCQYTGTGVPQLEPCHVIPERLRAFTFCKNSTDEQVGIHFFIDDHRFSWCWSDPNKYIPMLKRFACVLTPDFSVYVDMPLPLQRFNTFRNRAVGWIWQQQSIEVIPTLRWGFPESYEFCFDGLPQGGVVALSTLGLMVNEECIELFREGAAEGVRRSQPSAILAYGQHCDFDSGGTSVYWHENDVIARLRTIKRKDNSEGSE